MGKLKKPPGWILRYKERIENRTITVEEILDAENRIREVPLRRSSVARAINAMGYHTSEMLKEKKEEVKEPAFEPEAIEIETAVAIEPRPKERGPKWLQKYRAQIENRTITVEDILEAENRIREVPLKRSSVARAINAMGYHTSEMPGSRKIKKRMAKEKEKEVEQLKKVVPEKVEPVAYSFNIDKITDATAKRFDSIKARWEEELGKTLHNDHFVNILIALAILVQKEGKLLTPVKK